ELVGLGLVELLVVVVVVVVVVLGLARGLPLRLALAGRDPAPAARPLGLGVGRLALTATVELDILVARHPARDVAGALADAGAAAACTRAPPLHRRAFVGEGAADEELFLGHVVVVLGVGDRGVEQLHDRLGRAALAEAQDLARVGDVL